MCSLRRCPAARAWQRRSVGYGRSRVRCWYSWALTSTNHRESTPTAPRLVSITCWSVATTRPASWPIYRCYSPQYGDPLLDYVRGGRVALEGRGILQTSKRNWPDWMSIRCAAGPSWHRWVTLAMLAHAFLVVTTAAQTDVDTWPGPH